MFTGGFLGGVAEALACRPGEVRQWPPHLAAWAPGRWYLPSPWHRRRPLVPCCRASVTRWVALARPRARRSARGLQDPVLGNSLQGCSRLALGLLPRGHSLKLQQTSPPWVCPSLCPAFSESLPSPCFAWLGSAVQAGIPVVCRTLQHKLFLANVFCPDGILSAFPRNGKPSRGRSKHWGS